jgi:hypothetical protein
MFLFGQTLDAKYSVRVMIAGQLGRSSRSIFLPHSHNYMDRFHSLVVEDFDGVDICPEHAPFLVGLVIAAQIGFFLSLVVTVSSVVCECVPLDSTIAVASYVVCVLDRFPLDSCAWEPCHP